MLLIGMLTLAFNIQPVKASGTIYIRADGGVDPSTAPISTTDNVIYTLTDNIYDEIVVERNNIIIDGKRYTLQGSGSGNGFYLSGINNVTIKNTNIKDFYYGVLFNSASHNVLSANNIINNQYGVFLLSSNYNSIFENNVTDNEEKGVWVYESNNNTIFGNNLANNHYRGLDLSWASNNTLLENKINGSRYNFGVSYGFMHLIDVSNLVNGRPIYYLVNQNDLTLNPEILPQVGYLALINCVNITVEGFFLASNYQGILLANTKNSTIENNKITNNNLGIEFFDSSNNVMSGNNITKNDLCGVWFTLSNYNSIAGNNITNNNEGIHLCGSPSHNNSVSGNNIANNDDGVFSSSDNNTISANNITKNTYCGIKLESSCYYSIYGNNITKNGNYGITLFYSSNDTISGNNITNNYYGISFSWSYNNSISENNLEKNYAGGLYLSASSNNTFYHNNFIDNSPQIYLSSYYPPGKNVWDNGYPSGGNYWSDYAGVDVKKGSGQDMPGSDGIGDTPYVIDANNRDHYPLMNPYGTPPPPTYALTIITTVGGTTDPALGTYSYTANSQVQVTSFPNTGYLFDHWELDSVNIGSANPYTVLMDKNHTLKAFFSPIPPPLSVSISPLSASILAGQSATFTSTISGGYTPYNYQWYLNSNPVSGANASSWTFTPTTAGIYYIYLKVIDAKGNTAQSETARITASVVPVGGYSTLIERPATAQPVLPYIAIMMILTLISIKMKPKSKRKH